MGLLKIFFVIVVFLIPLGELIRVELSRSIIIKPLDISVAILVVVWLVNKLKSRSGVIDTFILYPVLLFLLIGAISLLANYSWIRSLQYSDSILYFLRWGIYIGVYFVVNEFDKSFKRTISLFMFFAGSIFIVLGYVQYAFYQSLKGFIYLGWDEHMYRMFSTFLDPNFAGVFFVLFFTFQLGKLLLKDFRKSGTGSNILHYSLLVFTLGAIFLTFSRSAMFMFIISSFVFFTLIGKKRLIFILLGIFVFVFLISSKYFNIENVNPFRTVSTNARLETTLNALKIVQDNPILGVGFNTYRYAQIRYGFRKEVNAVESHADAAPDNSFLFVLATTGIVGFMSYMFLWFRFIKRAVRNYRISRNVFGAIFIASACGLFVNALFINSLFYPPIMLWMWILNGLMDYK